MDQKTNQDPARLYREAVVRSATPVGLIAILYEEIVRSLHKALDGIQEKKIEPRCLALSHVIQIIGYLQSILDFERGGQVARQLSNFYNVARAKAFEANVKVSEEIVQQLIEQFRLLAEAWREVEKRVTGGESQTVRPTVEASFPVPQAEAEESSMSWTI